VLQHAVKQWLNILTLVLCLRSDSYHYWHSNRSFYLLTYLLNYSQYDQFQFELTHYNCCECYSPISQWKQFSYELNHTITQFTIGWKKEQCCLTLCLVLVQPLKKADLLNRKWHAQKWKLLPIFDHQWRLQVYGHHGNDHNTMVCYGHRLIWP